MKKNGFVRKDTQMNFYIEEAKKAMFRLFKNKNTKKKKKSKSRPLQKIESKVEEVHKEIPDWKRDLSSNLGSILKPSIPDFGYAEHMYFDEEDSPGKRTGWGPFVEFIKKYPVTSKAQNIIESIKKEKQLEEAKRKKKPKKRRIKPRKKISYNIQVHKTNSDAGTARSKKNVYFEDLKMQSGNKISSFKKNADVKRRQLPSILPGGDDMRNILNNLKLARSDSKSSISSSISSSEEKNNS